MEPLFRQISIIGTGLIGGSLGLTIHKKKLASKVVGIGRNPDKLDKALKRKSVDEVTTEYSQGVQEADLVIICTPVRCIVPIFKEIFPYLPQGCIVTDAGSTKNSIVQNIQNYLSQSGKKVYFIGSHPMAGSEKSGIEAAQEDLYEGSLCIITPPAESLYDPQILKRIESFWEKIGCRISRMEPQKHDLAVAAISHLPHLVSAILVNTVSEMDNNSGHLFSIASSGFKDTTRVASGNPNLWSDISLENKEALINCLEIFETQLQSFKKEILSSNPEEISRLFEKAKHYRDSMVNSKK